MLSKLSPASRARYTVSGCSCKVQAAPNVFQAANRLSRAINSASSPCGKPGFRDSAAPGASGENPTWQAQRRSGQASIDPKPTGEPASRLYPWSPEPCPTNTQVPGRISRPRQGACRWTGQVRWSPRKGDDRGPRRQSHPPGPRALGQLTQKKQAQQVARRIRIASRGLGMMACVDVPGVQVRQGDHNSSRAAGKPLDQLAGNSPATSSLSCCRAIPTQSANATASSPRSEMSSKLTAGPGLANRRCAIVQGRV